MLLLLLLRGTEVGGWVSELGDSPAYKRSLNEKN